jgi:hypothetical protein
MSGKHHVGQNIRRDIYTHITQNKNIQCEEQLNSGSFYEHVKTIF